MKLGILFGGKSPEHEVSCVSATAVIEAADKKKYDIVTIGITKAGKWLLYDGPVENIKDGSWEAIAEKAYAENPEKYGVPVLSCGGRSLKDICDFVFPAVHGPYCEDGKLQGLLEMIDMPYAGPGVLASAVCMDKIMAKMIFQKFGLPIGPYLGVDREDIDHMDQVNNWVKQNVKYPVFVKPANMGSSVGITKVKKETELEAALREAAKYDRRIIIEQAIEGREIEISVWGNTSDEYWSSCPGEIGYTAEFYDYQAKYQDEDGLTLTLPADLPEDKLREIAFYAKAAFMAVDGQGFARCDFFLDKDNRFWLNEINTLPGCTAVSMFPLMWQKAGRTFTELVDKAVELGLKRYNEKNASR